MKIQPVKGTRDFYPAEMAVRNFIIDGWKAAAVRNGFEEYDGPIFEYLKMFQIKSGDEIAEQLFNFTDRGDRALAIRPEITPTLARMVNQKINALPRPIKWFSVPRLCRAERPQKGRLREFFQWNIDIIGVDEVLADAEVIFTAVDYLRQVGLTADDIVVKISSRKLLAAVLQGIGVPESKLNTLYALLDKKTKLPPETFNKFLAEQVPDQKMADAIVAFMEVKDFSEISQVVEVDSLIQPAEDELGMLIQYLNIMGLDGYYVFDPGIVRGLAYYTGVVFEIYSKVGELRAICGGGRYDNLLGDFGGPQITGTGFGMGDCVLEILLREKGLLEDAPATRNLDDFVVCTGRQFMTKVVEITARLRATGVPSGFSYKDGSLKKQLKEASLANAKRCIIIGAEYDNGELVVKDMATGKQETVSEDRFWAELEGRKG
ncbi:MAG: histidine--tRNA ligase [Planctomycetota bacterium]|jgi:histidyl-tRNA synthetase